MRNAILIASLLLTACAANPDDSGIPSGEQQIGLHPDGKADGGESCDFSTLEGLYNAFGYKTIEHADGSHSYRIGMTWQSVTRLSNGDEADFTLYLLPEARVIIDYSERHRIDASSLEETNHALVVTTASMQSDGTIRLAGVATGKPTQLTEGSSCAAGLKLSFTDNLVTSGLVGNTASIYVGTSTAWVADPDHLDQIPSADGRAYITQEIADGSIKVIHRN